MKKLDVSPYGFPNSPAGEVRFEETRDVEIVEVDFEGAPPDTARLQYLRKTWPGDRIERLGDMDQARPSLFGWMGMDDQFTPEWADAATEAAPISPQTLRFAFKPLRTEIPDFPDAERYDVAFRRTLAVRVVGSEQPPRAVRVFTCSQPSLSALRVELHAGRQTPGETVEVSGYNAVVKRMTDGIGNQLGWPGSQSRGCPAGALRVGRRAHGPGPPLRPRRRAPVVHDRAGGLHDLPDGAGGRKGRSGSPRPACTSPGRTIRRRSSSTARASATARRLPPGCPSCPSNRWPAP